ncbi:DNA phosphorothioation-dependent restriction protein DptF [Clostridium aestuarii]|uniref:DNA phosphorothioation-dependent restriction protein DptF n=1 Tax=Clostridium aestuarii TaxID=338193 RepID=A0ABT4CVK6_9CLOT|nr:DNA phosphorothioation-dependent restriction protein DptF [Clostridium aestuarii]MCY6483013.1 DNA phosphorothioation-dependent restriction protein DptF [Clostridium aestuarii]
MENDVFSYLDKDYRYLNNYIRNFNKIIFTSPQSVIVKGKNFAENLIQEVSKLEGYGLLTKMTQIERLTKLEGYGVLKGEIDKLFHAVRILGNEEIDTDVERELEVALNIHKNIYKITCWFIQNYIDDNFEVDPYKNPIPSKKDNTEMISNLMKKMESSITETQEIDKSDVSIDDNSNMNEKDEAEDIFEDLMIESIIDDKESDEKCLIQELSRLKETSKECVEGLGGITPFKRYMHIERDAQKELESLIFKANESDRAQLILACGSVGDGKKHIISYVNNNYPDVMEKFTIHNDTIENLESNKTSMDNLNKVLNDFSDKKIEKSKKKLILAINIEKLNAFIDSQYGEKFSILKRYIQDKKILENSIVDSSFNENSPFQFVNFNDYHMFTLKNGKVHSDYIKDLITKITDVSELNIFYNSYKKNCIKCSNCDCCPIKANYELLSNEKVQESIADLVVQCIIKNKIIISTRALINFMYELIVPISYINVNSPVFKKNISKLNNLNYIKSLMPNIIFNHKKLSFIFEALSSLDPSKIKNKKINDFIINFNESKDILLYFKEYIDYPKGYIDKIKHMSFEEIEDKKIKYELLKLFIRSYYICENEDVFSLKDHAYENYMEGLYFWNRGDKLKLKTLYDNVKNGIVKWNGGADKDQIEHKISEELEFKADTSNLPKSKEADLKKFITTLKLKYKSEKLGNAYEIDVDFTLYKLLIQVIKGYRPNNLDNCELSKVTFKNW